MHQGRVVRAQASSTNLDPFGGLPSDCSMDDGDSYQESSFRSVALGGKRKVHPLTLKVAERKAAEDAKIKEAAIPKNEYKF